MSNNGLTIAMCLGTPCVYAVKAPSLNHMKIGYCSKFSGVRRRIAQVQTGVSEPLLVIAITVASRSWEQQMHSRFSERRLHGEWFDDFDFSIEEFFLGIVPVRDRAILALADSHAELMRKQERLNTLNAEVNELRFTTNKLLSEVNTLNDIRVAA